MRFADLVRAVAGNLIQLRWRLVLTLAGVVIGTVSVVLMLAVGAGLQRSIGATFGQASFATQIDVQARSSLDTADAPEASRGSGVRMAPRRLDDRSVERMRSIPGVAQAVGTISAPVDSLSLGRSNALGLVTGIAPADMRRWGYRLRSGRLPNAPRELVLGAKVPDSFGQQASLAGSALATATDLVGRSLTLHLSAGAQPAGSDGSAQQTVRARVVGILAPADAQTDITAYLPIEEARSFDAGASSREYESVMVRAQNASGVSGIVSAIKELGFQASSAADAGKLLDVVMRFVQVALGSIGAIALVVSALGIANTMTTAILERTKDIGIMMAIGASRATILRLFLLESTAIGIAGGVLGLLLSAGVAWVANAVLSAAFSSQAGMSGGGLQLFYIPSWLAVFAVTFAGVVGLVAGLVPAARASRLSPLSAIRRE